MESTEQVKHLKAAINHMYAEMDVEIMAARESYQQSRINLHQMGLHNDRVHELMHEVSENIKIMESLILGRKEDEG